MTNQYMTKLYHDLLSNSPQTVTIDIPADMGTGQISQVVTKQGAVVSDWKMNYFSDMNVQGVSCEDDIQLLFCFNDGVSWNIADARQSVSIQKGESCIYRGHGKMEYLCYSGKTDFLFKNIKIANCNIKLSDSSVRINQVTAGCGLVTSVTYGSLLTQAGCAGQAA